MPHLLAVSMGLVALLTVHVSAALAQAEARTEKSVEEMKETPWMKLDVDTLLMDPQVLSSNASDEIWNIVVTPGKRMIQIPFLIKADGEEHEITSRTAGVRSAVFMAWKLNDPREEAPRGSEAERELIAAVPDGAPRICRSFKLTADGHVQWDLDRGLKNGSIIRSGRAYAYKLDRELLRDLHPGEPPAAPRGGTRADFAAAAAQQAQYRAQVDEYRRVNEEVRDLPDTFDMPAPMRVWAIYEISLNIRDLEIEGPEPLPWKVPFYTFEEVRNHAQTPATATETAGGNWSMPQNTRVQIELMREMVDSGHLYDYRVAAFAMSRSFSLQYANFGDSTYKLIYSLLDGPDVTARRIMVKELIQVLPPTSASLNLLEFAASKIDPVMQMEALVGLMRGNTSDPAAAQKMLAQANKLLADPNGPPPSEVLQKLDEAAADDLELQNQLIYNIDFESLPDNRMRPTLAYVVQNATDSPLSNGWLNRLLGSLDPKATSRVLELLMSASTVNEFVQQFVDRSLDSIFGPPPASADGEAIGNVRLSGPIPIHSSEHSLFRALQHGDEEIRRMAWQSLSRFKFVDPPVDPNNPNATPNVQRDPYKALVDIALSSGSTPSQVVDFIKRQNDAMRVGESLVTLTARASDVASRQATAAILNSGSPLPLGDILVALPQGSRHSFVERTYANAKGGRAPLVVGLLGQQGDTSQLLYWLGDEIGSGNLPGPSAWLQPAGGLERMLELVTAQDRNVRIAAAAALVADAGGNDQMVPTISAGFQNVDTTAGKTVRTEWDAARAGIFAKRLEQSAGAYQLTLDVAAGQGVMALEAQTVDLGVVRLLVRDGAVKLADDSLPLSVPSGTFGISLDDPRGLKNFPADELASIPLENAQGPVILLPQEDGSFIGEFGLMDGRRIVLTLRRLL